MENNKVWLQLNMCDGIVMCLQAALLNSTIQNCPLQNVQTSTGAQPHSYWMATSGSFPRVEQSGHEVTYFPAHKTHFFPPKNVT